MLTVINCCTCANILMITMGGTKSHKIPFFELARGLIPRGHNITFLNAFPSDFYMEGMKIETFIVNIIDIVANRFRRSHPN